MNNPYLAVSSCYGKELAPPTTLRSRFAHRLFFAIKDGNKNAIIRFQAHTKNAAAIKISSENPGHLTFIFYWIWLQHSRKPGHEI
jgi:hypothetical protein